MESSTTPLLTESRPVLGGWSVHSALPWVGRVQRYRAVRDGGRAALLEAISFPAGQRRQDWLDALIDDVEAWEESRAFLRVFGAGAVPDAPAVVVRVLELPPGLPLASWVGRPSSVAQAVHLAGQIARAVAAAHARGLVHGQLTADRVHIASGQARVEPGGVYVHGAHAVSRPDDVRALGLLLTTMLTGDPSAPVPRGLPPALTELLEGCLAPASRRPPISDVVLVLRRLESEIGPPEALIEPTPASIIRTVTPRLGLVDVPLAPAPPPAPELRSVIPSPERRLEPVEQPGLPAWAMWAAVGALVASLGLLAAWWFTAP